MQENLQEMVKNLNTSSESKVEEVVKIVEEIGPPVVEEPAIPEIKLTNFYDWYEKNDKEINDVHRMNATASKVNVKDSMIFKIPKGKNEEMELVSFYNPSARQILNLKPVYVKIFKNDTFLILHQFNDDLFIKSYGLKNGLIVMYCVNIDGNIIPIIKHKVDKKADSIKLVEYIEFIDKIKNDLLNPVNFENIQLLYKQAEKFKDQFTTKQSALDWFLKKQVELIDINHLLKIDIVLLNIFA